MKERIQTFLNKIYPELAFKGYRLEIKNKEILELLSDPNIPFLVYFNHLAGDDPIIITALVNQATQGKRSLILPVSQEYVSLRGGLPWYAIGVLGAKHLLGWRMEEIVQAYRLRDERLTREEMLKRKEESSDLSMSFFRNVRRKLQQGEKPIIIISPEGHRSDQGLLPAEDGVGFLAKLIGENNGLILPIGLNYHDGKRGLNYNPFNPLSVDVVVGQPFRYVEALNMGKELYSHYGLSFSGKPEEIAHTLMWYLTTLLPEELHGCYDQTQIGNTLAGRRHLGVNSEGKVVVMNKD